MIYSGVCFEQFRIAASFRGGEQSHYTLVEVPGIHYKDVSSKAIRTAFSFMVY